MAEGRVQPPPKRVLKPPFPTAKIPNLPQIPPLSGQNVLPTSLAGCLKIFRSPMLDGVKELKEEQMGEVACPFSN